LEADSEDQVGNRIDHVRFEIRWGSMTLMFSQYVHQYRRLHNLDSSPSQSATDPSVSQTPPLHASSARLMLNLRQLRDDQQVLGPHLQIPDHVRRRGPELLFLANRPARIVKYHGLTKYAPLVRFNSRLMVLSVAMDVCLPLTFLVLPLFVSYLMRRWKRGIWC
jgi:hypothetical protein